MRNKIVGIFICMLLILTILPVSANVIVDKTYNFTIFGNTLYVGGNGPNNYTKIQDAIDDASSGDTVFVYDDSSPYYEHIDVYKSINLVGENHDSTIINGENIENIIILSSDYVTFTGFTIKNIGGASVGILVNGVNGCLIYNNKITDTFVGIELFNINKICSNNVVTENIVLYSIAAGIELRKSNNNTISYNIISNIPSGSGISIDYFSSSNIIKNNNITNSDQAGISISFISDKNIIIDNTISSSIYNGIAICYSSNQIIEKNIISNCSNGIFLFYSSNCIIKDNSLSYNKYQIKLYYCYDLTIILNILSNTEWYGIYIELSERIIVKENTLTNDKIWLSSANKNQILNNTITFNGGSSNGVILIINSSYNNISGNDIKSCEKGLYFIISHNNLVTNNNIINNQLGIFLDKSDNNIINSNSFKGNKKHASFQDCNNFWDSNYWNRIRFNPYIIIGTKTIKTYILGEIQFLSLNYDYNPAKEPYYIGL